MSKKTLSHVSVKFGSDPEMFFIKDNKVVPSKEVIGAGISGVDPDGYQFELHPSNSHCREIAASAIARIMKSVKDHTKDKGVEISFAVGYDLDDESFRKLPPKERRFGCKPTFNIYETGRLRPTGLREKFRSGGGHIHLEIPTKYRTAEHLPRIVRLMDIVVGNTCVIFDQDPASKKRRKFYGRAGEYRAKPYGLEYRVPSNFWMRGYFLWSMVAVLMRNSMQFYASDYYDTLTKLFPEDSIRKAINDNDKELAMANLNKLCAFIKENGIGMGSGLDVFTVDSFLKLCNEKDIYKKLGLSTPKDSFDSWAEKLGGWAEGFESKLETLYSEMFDESYWEEDEEDEDDY